MYSNQFKQIYNPRQEYFLVDLKIKNGIPYKVTNKIQNEWTKSGVEWRVDTKKYQFR